MDFLKKFTDATKLGGGDDTKETPHPTTTATIAADSDNPPSQNELFASAQVVAEAAKAAIGREPTNVDNYKLAGATADILDAAEHYGKIDTTSGYGSYVEKAEGYLKNYESSNSPKSSPTADEEETIVKPKSTIPVESESSDSTTPPPKSSPVADAEETVVKPKSTIPVEGSEETYETKTSPPPPVAEEEEVSEKKEVESEERAIPPPAETETAPTPSAPAHTSETPVEEEKKAEGYGGALKAAGDFWKKN